MFLLVAGLRHTFGCHRRSRRLLSLGHASASVLRYFRGIRRKDLVFFICNQHSLGLTRTKVRYGRTCRFRLLRGTEGQDEALRGSIATLNRQMKPYQVHRCKFPQVHSTKLSSRPPQSIPFGDAAQHNQRASSFLDSRFLRIRALLAVPQVHCSHRASGCKTTGTYSTCVVERPRLLFVYEAYSC